MTSKFRNIFTYILSFTACFVGIALNFILARFLKAELYGRLQYFVALSTTFSQFMILGLNSFLIREAKNKNQSFDVFSRCISLYAIVSMFSLGIINFILRLDDSVSELFRFLIMCLSVLIGLNTLITSMFQGKGKYHLSIVFENLIPKVFLLSVTVIFYLLSSSNVLANLYLPLYIIIYIAIAIPILINNFKGFKISFSNSELSSILFFYGVTITYSLGNNLTKVLQGGLYQNEIALATISVSLSLISLLRVFTSVLDNIVKPLFAKLKREGNYEKMLDVYRFDTRMNAYVSIPLFLFFIIHSSRFLYIFGQSYLEYPMILSLLAIANAANELTGPSGTMLAMIGKEKWELFNGFLYFLFYFISIFIFSFNKVYGLCICLIVGQIVVNIAKYIEVFVLFKRSPLDRWSILSLILIGMIDYGVIFALSFMNNSLLWFLAAVPVGIILVGVNCFILSFYRKKDYKTLLEIRL